MGALVRVAMAESEGPVGPGGWSSLGGSRWVVFGRHGSVDEVAWLWAAIMRYHSLSLSAVRWGRPWSSNLSERVWTICSGRCPSKKGRCIRTTPNSSGMTGYKSGFISDPRYHQSPSSSKHSPLVHSCSYCRPLGPPHLLVNRVPVHTVHLVAVVYSKVDPNICKVLMWEIQLLQYLVFFRPHQPKHSSHNL